MKINLSQRLSQKSLLATRICDLDICLKKHRKIQKQITTVCYELRLKGFTQFKPSFYLGDEWFSPEGICSVSIPFYLAHPKLLKLEKKLNNEAEGETKSWSLRLLRHEIGHCFDHAFKVSKLKSWQQIFGNPNKKYDVDNYSFDPLNKDYVINLEDSYGQAHPDEDFAETFAVWLQFDNKEWQKKYHNFPKALSKLNYVNKLCNKFLEQKPKASNYSRMGRASHLRSTLFDYYKKKKSS
jgi:hypothetical protein